MRQLVILHNITGEHFTQIGCPAILLPNQTVIPFSNSKSLLGNEYPYAIYDMRAEGGVNLHLEALAIVAGTIQEGGTLYLLCSDWDNLETQIDFDSLRWNDGKAVATPNFYRYFRGLVEKYGFEIRYQKSAICSPLPSPPPQAEEGIIFTDDQQKILKNLPLDPADIHLITAPRGRGKSTLAGKLATKIACDQPVIITARSHAALPNFWKQVESEKVRFFAPDRLIQAVENGENFAKTWLFIDEAASLPLPMLQRFCAAFGKVVMTSTTQNYEGTGRGFALKLPKMLEKPFRHWRLSQPLRWGENDVLEAFINDLLLLSDEQTPLLERRGAGEIWQKTLTKKSLSHSDYNTSQISPNPSLLKRGTDLEEKIAFYHLLSNAHYKTTPSDLRRLFDGENQRLFDIREKGELIAGCWAVTEGGLSEELTAAIWRGERHPKGNLVAQYLCFQGNLPEACRLRSLRISRIAVQPEKQGCGYGKRLVSEIILQISAENSPLVDFVSVSFGLNDELLRFWQSCGFELVQITPNAEASSGLPSAMMLYPISEAGKQFVRHAVWQFERDRQSDLRLTESDWQNLAGFAQFKRTFAACEMSLTRLIAAEPTAKSLLPLIETVRSAKNNQKNHVERLRQAVKNLDLFAKNPSEYAEL